MGLLLQNWTGVGTGPATQTPALQASPTVQTLPSVQGPATGALMQPDPELQESAVQTLLSLQLTGV
jgi:hypothetical protein